MKTALTIALLLLAISLSTGTAKAQCTLPTPAYYGPEVVGVGNAGCWGDGSMYSYPTFCDASGCILYSNVCIAPAVYSSNEGGLCWWVNCSTIGVDPMYETLWLYLAVSYGVDYADNFFGCDYYSKAKTPDLLPFKRHRKDEPIEAKSRHVNILPYRGAA